MFWDVTGYAAAVAALQVVLIAPPGLVLARRLRVRRPWLALVPVLMFAKITDCGRQGLPQKFINGIALGLVVPVAVSVPATRNAVETSPYETGTTSADLYWGFASTLALVICLGVWMATWDGVCRATGQNPRKVWLFFVPLVNLVTPWVIALQAKPRAGLAGVPGTNVSGMRPLQASGGIATAPRLSEGDRGTPGRRRWRALALPVWHRPPAWLLSNAVLVALFLGFLLFGGSGVGFGQGGASEPKMVPATPTPEPDRVVGVVERCDAVNEKALARLARDGCAVMVAAYPQAVMNHRLEVTVRTFSGAVYVIEVSPSTRVSLGDVWPPSR